MKNFEINCDPNFDSDAKLGCISLIVVAFVGIFLFAKCCAFFSDDNYDANTQAYSTSYTTTATSSYSSDNSPYLEIGNSYKIVSNTFVGTTKDNLKEIYNYALNNNSEGMLSMAILGQGTILSYGAVVAISSYDGMAVKLRIISDGCDGEANGYYVYAFQSDIRNNTIKY